MGDTALERIPVVAGLGFVERVRRLPSSFTATLVAEPGHPYFRHAIAVVVSGEKVGYVAPEVAAGYFEALSASETQVTCPGRRGTTSDHETSGVELLLNFTGLSVYPSE